jgi:hypothetical protein
MLKIPPEYDRDASVAKLTNISRHVSPALLPGVSAGIGQRSLVDESGKIKTEMWRM